MSCELLRIYYDAGPRFAVGKMPLDPSGETRMLILGSLMGSDSTRRSGAGNPLDPGRPIRLAARSWAPSATLPFLDNRDETKPP
jgi:hypothetical protein